MNKDYSNPIVFSENDIYLNWEKWITGESHVLIIDGLSGSGKSTLASKIAKQEGAVLVSSDTMAFAMAGQKFIDRGHCNYEYVREKEPLLYKYLKVKNIPIDFMTHLKFDPVTFTHSPEEEEYKQQQVDKYIEWLCFEQHEKVVIEGGHAGVTLSRSPEKYENTPIIFKGTSMFKSIFRRFFRALGKGHVHETLMLIFKVKAQYIDKMLPEVNTARKAMLTGREDDILNVNEGFVPIEASKDDKPSIHKKKKLDLRKIPTNIKDFREFLQRIKTPEMVMMWFIKNKIRWTPGGGDNNHPFQWPDYLIKQKMGNCFDQSVFMHYFCKAKKLEHKMYLVTWISDKGEGTGHAVPLYKKNGYVYVFTYLRPSVGFIAGPFRDFDEARGVLDKYFLMYINKTLSSPSTPYSSFLSDEDLNNFDKYYNDRSITQTDYIIEGLGKNMRSSHMFKLKAKGIVFPNPMLPAYDFITFIWRAITFMYNHFMVDDNTETVEEESINESKNYWTFDDLYDISHKKKFDKIKNFDQFCREIESPEEALSYLILEKVNWTDDEGMGIDRVFYWPDDVIRDKIGVCMDQTILINYFLRYKHIEYRYLFMSWNGEDNSYHGSHVVPAFKRDGRYFSVIYLPNYIGWIYGPFDSWDECAHETGHALESLLSSAKKRVYALTEYAPKEFDNEIDKIYGKKVKFHYWLMADGGRVVRWSKMVQIQYGRFAFWNPIVTLWDITRFLRNTFGWDLPYYGLPKIDKKDYIEEAKLSADERRCFGLPKKKKYPMPDEAHVRAAIRFFNHCDPEDEEELARNINKYIRKYNMKDVHVGENNRFKKYYKPINEDYLEEGLLPTVTMYHGSYLKLKTLKPFAYNAGTKFRKPSWSVFMWAQWDLAYKWAAFVSLKKAIRTERKELGLELPVGEHYRIGFNTYGYKLYIKYDEFDKIKELAMKYQPKFYVYTVKAPIDTKLGAGNNSMQPEYTYDGELKIHKREEFTLTEEIFDDLFEPVTSIKYAEIRKFEGENIRGPLGWIFRPNDETMKEWIYVTKGVQQGLFKPGDDLDKILDDYYASLEESVDINQSNDIQTIPFIMQDHGNGTAGIVQSPITEDTKVKSDQEQFLEIYLFIRACVNSSRQALELLESGGGCMVGMDINHVTVQNYTPGMFIIQYTADDEKKAYAITNDIKSKYIYREYHNRLIKEEYSYLNDKEFKLYKLDSSCIPQWANLLNKILANKTITSIYEELTNTKLISDSQIKNDSRFEEVIID